MTNLVIARERALLVARHARARRRGPRLSSELTRTTAEEEPISFESAKAMEKWLARNHATSKGIWVRFFKKDSGVRSITTAEALDAALCYGWITGQARPYDGRSWLARFVPRRARSIWSQLNTAHAERLIKEGRMKPPGFREIEAAKADGRWDRAYSSPRAATLPADFVRALKKSKRAKAFLETLNRANVYAIIFRLHHTKTPDRRREKIRSFIQMLENGQKFHD